MNEHPMTKEALRRAFDTSPDTVYGVLVGLLVLALIYMAWRLSRKDKKLMELNQSTIEVLKDLNTSLLLLKSEGNNLSERLVTHIDASSAKITDQIAHLKDMYHGREKDT